MKQVYSFRTGLEAHDARLFLESKRIEAKVFGDNNAFEIGFSFTPESAPGVFVNEADYDRAVELLEQFLERSNHDSSESEWTCGYCGEPVDGHFDLCWNCESPRSQSPIVATIDESEPIAPEDEIPAEDETDTTSLDDSSYPSHGNWYVLIEVLCVFGLLWLMKENYGKLDLNWTKKFSNLPFIAFSVGIIVYEVLSAAIVITALLFSKEPFSRFGLGKFHPLMDSFIGGIVYFGTLFIYTVGIDVLTALLDSLFRPGVVQRLMEDRARYWHPTGGLEIVFGAVAMLCVAFSEEFVMRGYLIPRLERLLRWSWCSVLVSAAIFAWLHLYQGVVGVWGAFWIGVIFGVVFLYVRRIWPLVIAHFLIDFLVLVHKGL